MSLLFLIWEDVETVSAQDFMSHLSGDHTAVYLNWKNVSKYLGYFCRAFPSKFVEDDDSNKGDRVLASCPSEFEKML